MCLMRAPLPLSPDVLGRPEGIANPYPAYRAFEQVSPVRYLRVPAGLISGSTEPIYSWALLRHAHVFAAVRDPATFSSWSMAKLNLVPKLALLHDDPPRHTHLRRLVSKAFSPQRIATFSDWIGRIVNELLDAAGRGPAELMSAYAIPLPMRVICRMLGIPDEEYATFRHWSEGIVAYAGIPADERARRTAAMMGYLDRLIATRRAQPTEDLVSALIKAEVEGQSLSDTEVRSFIAVLLIAGNETTTNLIGNMMAILADRAELWERARDQRSLVDPIIEEVLRYESPVQRMTRMTTRPVRVGEVEIGEGELVDLVFGAANRDPAVFEDPDTFNLERANKDQHLGFGLGTHFCLGAPLARLEARLTLNAFLDRFATLRRGEGQPERQQAAHLSLGYKSLPLVLG